MFFSSQAMKFLIQFMPFFQIIMFEFKTVSKVLLAFLFIKKEGEAHVALLKENSPGWYRLHVYLFIRNYNISQQCLHI